MKIWSSRFKYTCGMTVIKANMAHASRVMPVSRCRIASVHAKNTSSTQRSSPTAGKQRELRQTELVFAFFEKRLLVPPLLALSDHLATLYQL